MFEKMMVGYVDSKKAAASVTLFVVGSLVFGVWVAAAVAAVAYFKLDFKANVMGIVCAIVYLVISKFLGAIVGLAAFAAIVGILGFAGYKAMYSEKGGK